METFPTFVGFAVRDRASIAMANEDNTKLFVDEPSDRRTYGSIPSGSGNEIRAGYDVGSEFVDSTLDESVWETLKRDLVRVGRNLKQVLLPTSTGTDGTQHTLRDWDLWGPLVFVLVLSSALCIGASHPSTVFAVVFVIVSVGAVVLTANVQLLGGHIIFFQSLCVLGYCLFPLSMAAVASIFLHNKVARMVVVTGAVLWAASAALPFIGSSVPDTRRVLAVYPLLLLYTCLAWLTLVKS
mmetsp:Transcript_7099/g.43932  ORF Transcript_7099/g.43932 Transcript_7099/m.43932 type:complete len:240 (+) Transcript_7099:62-781(+)